MWESRHADERTIDTKDGQIHKTAGHLVLLLLCFLLRHGSIMGWNRCCERFVDFSSEKPRAPG